MKNALCIALCAALAWLIGCNADPTNPIGSEEAALTVANPNDGCQRSIPLNELFTPADIDALPFADSFSPPVLDGEDQWTVSGKTQASKYAIVTSHLDYGVKPNHLGLDYSSRPVPGTRFAVRAPAKGLVIFAGYVCKGDTGVPDANPKARYTGWGISVRVLHKAHEANGTTMYYVSTLNHMEGDPDGRRGLEKLSVRVGDVVDERTMIGHIGTTAHENGDLDFAPHLHFELRKVADPFATDQATWMLVNYAGFGYVDSRSVASVDKFYLDPTAFFGRYGQTLQGMAVQNYPPGTMVFERLRSGETSRRDYSLIDADGVLRHIANEAALNANRLYHDGANRWEEAVEIDANVRSCFANGPDVTDATSVKAIGCPTGTYVTVFGRDGMRTARKVTAASGSDAYSVLLKSWGLTANEVHVDPIACAGVPKGTPLVLRDGTVVEEASSNDFWVVSNGGLAQRLTRATFMFLHYPFETVVQIPDGTLPSLISGANTATRAFNDAEARRCISGPHGGGADNEPTTPTPIPPNNTAPAPLDPAVNRTWSAACAPGKRMCDGGNWFAVCMQDASHGFATYWDSWYCGKGSSCIDDGQCFTPPTVPTPSVPAAPVAQTVSDTAHTLRCASGTDGSLTLTLTGPMQSGLVGGSVSSPARIEYGSDSDGWSVPYAAGAKASAAWIADDAAHVLKLGSGVDGFNLFLSDGMSGKWFDLVDADGDGVRWTVVGDCHADGGKVLRGANDSTASVPEAAGDGPTIVCVAGANAFSVSISGLTTAVLVDAPTGITPTFVSVGTDTIGWTTSPNPLLQATFVDEGTSMTMTMPAATARFNFWTWADDGRAYWFQLANWSAEGDCRIIEENGGRVLVR